LTGNILAIVLTFITVGEQDKWMQVSERIMPLDWCLKRAEEAYRRDDTQTAFRIVCIPTDQRVPFNAK
jgi:hypothetical protein